MKRLIHFNIYFIFMLIIFFFASGSPQSKYEKLVENIKENFMDPLWSPDGSMIAFTSIKYKGIWIIDLQNRNIKQITDETAAGFLFKWSKNSQSILTRVAKYDGMRRYNAVKIFNIKAGESFLLTDYRTMMPGLPSFTPDNNKVYMFGSNNLELFDSGIEAIPGKKSAVSSNIIYLRNDKIAVEDLISHQVKTFEPVKGKRVLNLRTSPDGSRVAFEIYGGDMYVMNTDGTGFTDLGQGYRPKWSPDNQHIVYIITKDDGYRILSSDIYTIKIDGTEKTNLTKTIDQIEMNPDWSPDGKKIAFDVPGEGSIYIIKAP